MKTAMHYFFKSLYYVFHVFATATTFMATMMGHAADEMKTTTPTTPSVPTAPTTPTSK